MTLNVLVDGLNPNVAQQTLWVYLRVNSTPTLSMAASLVK